MPFVVIIMLIGFPFIGGIIYMMVAQISAEGKLEQNKTKLFARMTARGIDTKPRLLREILPAETRSPVVFEKLWAKGKTDKGERAVPLEPK